MKKAISIIMLAMLTIGIFGFVPSLAHADTYNQSLWIRMRGIITQWGTTPVFGWLGAHVRMVNLNGTYREWAGVHVTWSEERPRLNCTEPPTENFTFTCYAAKTVQTTEIELNYSGYDLYILGLWNVVKITTTVLVNENGELLGFTREFEPLATNTTGELRILGNWKGFELSIDGFDTLSGFVVHVIMRYVEIKLCDLNDDGKVDVRDLIRVAKRYRTIPGLFNYDHDMDFNFDNTIDIGDLATLAANIEG